MDVTDHLRLSQGEEISVVQQVLRRVLESLPANISLSHAIGADRRSHRAVDDGDSILEDLFKRMLLVFCHVFLIVLSVASPQKRINPSCGFLTSTRRAGN